MTAPLDALLVLVLLLNFYLLGASRLAAVIRASALQGVVLGLAAVLVHAEPAPRHLLLALGATALKAVVIPAMLFRAMREAAIRREVEPIVGFLPSLALAAAATGVALRFAGTLPLLPAHAGTLLVPAALATVFSGFLLLTTRRKAILQAVGYLILENGVFLMGLTLVDAMPFLVEVGVLLDLFVALFVMGITIHHISRELSSLDTARLTALRD